VGGGYGTLSEIGHARKLGTPVVGLDTWSLKKEGYTGIIEAKSPVEAVETAVAWAKKR